MDNLELVYTAPLESARVMENITVVAWKGEFVLDVMRATLQAGTILSDATNKNKPAQPLLYGRVESGKMIRSEGPLVARTYSMASSRSIVPVDLWTIQGVANSLQYGGLSRICPPDNEDPELDIWDSETVLLCIHSTSVFRRRMCKW